MTAVETDIQYLLPTCDREGRAILTLMGSRMRDMKVRAVMTFWGGYWEKGWGIDAGCDVGCDVGCWFVGCDVGWSEAVWLTVCCGLFDRLSYLLWSPPP